MSAGREDSCEVEDAQDTSVEGVAMVEKGYSRFKSCAGKVIPVGLTGDTGAPVDEASCCTRIGPS